MGDVILSQETRKILAEGVKAEESGRSFDQLTAERDQKLIAILRARGFLGKSYPTK
jgi:hypothetical protein